MGRASFGKYRNYCREDGFPLIQVDNYYKCSRSHIDETIGSRRLAALEYDLTRNTIHFIFENGAVLPVDVRSVENMFFDQNFRAEYGPAFSDEDVDERLDDKEETLQRIVGRRIADFKVMSGLDPTYSEEIILLLDDNSTVRFVTTQLHENSLQIRTYQEDDPMVPAGVQVLHEDRRYWDQLLELESETSEGGI